MVRLWLRLGYVRVPLGLPNGYVRVTLGLRWVTLRFR